MSDLSEDGENEKNRSAEKFERILEVATDGDDPLVSVVIPTFNSGKYIEKCLQSLKNQTYKNVEIVVVDNYSKDKTREVARKYIDRVFIKGPERTAQVNYGIKKSKGMFIYRIECDFKLDYDIIEKCVNKILKGNYDALIVPELNIGYTFWGRCRELEKRIYLEDTSIEVPRFFKKECTISIGGYDEGLVLHEDYDIKFKTEKYGCKIGRIDGSYERHMDSLRFKDILKGSFYYGTTAHKFIQKYKSKAWIQLNPIKKAYFKCWRLLIKNPHYFIGLSTMKFFQYISAGLGYLVARLKK